MKERKEKKAQIRAIENARAQKILNGDLEPITIEYDLPPNERPYLKLSARRMSSESSIVQETTGTIKKQHGIRRAVVGSILTSSIGGGLVGSTTAGSKIKTTTVDKTIITPRQIDSGELILTNKRFIFVGNYEPVALPYEAIYGTDFTSNQIWIQYSGMLDDERYELYGENAKDIKLYYNGLTKHIVRKLPQL